MRRWAELRNTTIVMALLQPEPEVVAQFNDVLLLSEGRVRAHAALDGGTPPSAVSRAACWRCMRT